MQEHLNNVKSKYKKALEGESGATVTLEGHKFVDDNGEELPSPKMEVQQIKYSFN